MKQPQPLSPTTISVGHNSHRPTDHRVSHICIFFFFYFVVATPIFLSFFPSLSPTSAAFHPPFTASYVNGAIHPSKYLSFTTHSNKRNEGTHCSNGRNNGTDITHASTLSYIVESASVSTLRIKCPRGAGNKGGRILSPYFFSPLKCC